MIRRTGRDPDADPTGSPADPSVAKTSLWEDFIDIFYALSAVFARRRDGKFGYALLFLNPRRNRPLLPDEERDAAGDGCGVRRLDCTSSAGFRNNRLRSPRRLPGSPEVSPQSSVRCDPVERGMGRRRPQPKVGRRRF